MSAKRPLIVILQPYIPTYRAKFFQALIAKSAHAGIDVVIAAGQPTGQQAERRDSAGHGFAVTLRHREFRFLGRRATFRSWPRVARDADLVVLEQARRNIDIYRLFLPRFIRRNSIALWGHGADYAGSVNVLDELIRRALTRRADWFFAYTAAGVAAVCRQGVPGLRTTEVKNSTDTTELRQLLAASHGSTLASFRRVHGLGPRTAAYIGGLDSGKRIDLLIDASVEIAKELPDFRLLVAGDGHSRGAVEDAALRYPWVTYLGPVAGEEKALVLAAAALLMLPGSIGLVAVDALAAGLPIVATDDNRHGPEFDYLEPGITAVVTHPEVDAYANAVVSLLQDDERLKVMRAECLIAGQPYSIEAMADNFLSGITRFLDRRVGA